MSAEKQLKTALGQVKMGAKQSRNRRAAIARKGARKGPISHSLADQLQGPVSNQEGLTPYRWATSFWPLAYPAAYKGCPPHSSHLPLQLRPEVLLELLRHQHAGRFVAVVSRIKHARHDLFRALSVGNCCFLYLLTVYNVHMSAVSTVWNLLTSR